MSWTKRRIRSSWCRLKTRSVCWAPTGIIVRKPMLPLMLPFLKSLPLPSAAAGPGKRCSEAMPERTLWRGTLVRRLRGLSPPGRRHITFPAIPTPGCGKVRGSPVPILPADRSGRSSLFGALLHRRFSLSAPISMFRTAPMWWTNTHRAITLCSSRKSERTRFLPLMRSMLSERRTRCASLLLGSKIWLWTPLSWISPPWSWW